MTEERPHEAPRRQGRLVLFRHGQTDYNAQARITGIADATLTEQGREQAREAGRCLRGVRIDKVYSSTLSRAFQTAALALQHADQPHLAGSDGAFRIIRSADIVEIDSGDFTGRSYKTDPEVIQWQRDFYKAVPNGESYAAALVRVQRFFDQEVRPCLERGETVMVVCHAGVVRVFDYVLGKTEVPVPGNAGGQSGKRRPINNAAPVMYDFIDGRLVAEVVLGERAGDENTSGAPRPPKFG